MEPLLILNSLSYEKPVLDQARACIADFSPSVQQKANPMTSNPLTQYTPPSCYVWAAANYWCTG